jgi:PAS domain S-box-containing protein
MLAGIQDDSLGAVAFKLKIVVDPITVCAPLERVPRLRYAVFKGLQSMTAEEITSQKPGGTVPLIGENSPASGPRGAALTTFLAAIVESSGDAILARDLKGRILTWNRGAELMFGYAAHEVLGSLMQILIPPELLLESNELLKKVMSGERVDHYETVRLTKNGSRVNVSITMFLVKDHAGNVIGISKILRDIGAAKRVADERDRNAAFLKTLVDSSPDCIKVLDHEGNLLSINRRGCQLMEIKDPSGFLHESWLNLWPGDVRPVAKAALAEAMTGREGRFQARGATFQGTYKWWDTIVSRLPGAPDNFSCLLAISRDITEQKSANEALRRSEADARVHQEILQSTLQQLPMGIALISGTDFSYKLVNAAYQNLVPARPLLGKTIFDVWPEAQPGFGQLCKEVLRTGTPFRAVDEPFMIPGPSGESTPIRYFSMNLDRIALPENASWSLLLSVWETTQRKQSEEALRLSEQSYRTLVSQVRDYAIFRIDTRGIPSSWNEGVKNVLGFAEADFLGQPISDRIFTPEDIAEGIPGYEMKEAIRKGECTSDRWMRRFDGSRFYATGITTALRDSSGALLGFSKVMRDDTERIEATQSLERTVAARTADLSRINEQLEAFVYSVAHDLRSPLRAMVGFADLLLQRYSARLDDTGKQMLSRIQTSSQFMDKLLLDLLEYGRSTTGQDPLSSVPVSRAWEDAIFQCQFQIQQTNAAIETVEPLPTVLADKATLGQCLANLLGNALKFVPSEIQPRIRLWAETSDDFARIWLQDNGVGIPVEYHERIFKVFERLNGTRYPGTGIGLAIVRKGIERMGGRVGLESEPGKGARFWIELPKGN